MMSGKPLLLGAAFLIGATFAVSAQAQYQTYPYAAPYASVAGGPAAWNYDPYTSGLGPCPQRYRTDPQCRYTMQPTYGQPNYWPAH